MTLKQKRNLSIDSYAGRRDFFKRTALAASVVVIPGWVTSNQSGSDKELVRRFDEKAIHLAYFDPAEGAVPNPGMGINGYTLTDHMHVGYTETEWNRTQGLPPMPLEKATFDKMLKLPYVDNLYIRVEWRDIQKQQGKLEFPDVWNWVLEAAEKYGKHWSFRIMNCSPHSMAKYGVPDFLKDKLKMIPYWHNDNVPGPKPKFFPEYSDEYLKWWGESLSLLGEKFDDHPLLDYVDLSGYGFWGEMHHFARYSSDGPVINYQPGTPERIEVIVDRLISDHLAAFPKTPAALGLHITDYKAGLRAFEEGLCWARRDSFQTDFSTVETHLAQGLKPGSAMLWETILPNIHCPADKLKSKEYILYPNLPRYFDISCHYAAVGFNPWDTIWAHEHNLSTYEQIAQKIGYRIRPSIVWRRKIKNDPEEIVLGLMNDGCSAPPGQVTIHAKFPDGSKKSIVLPVGEPAPGAMKIYPIEFPASALAAGSEKLIELTSSIQIKGKKSPVQWAVKNSMSEDRFTLKVPIKQI